jgi:hypothetical protein
MFRTAFAFALIFLFSLAVSAAGLSPGPGVASVIQGNDGNSYRIKEDYVQSQLDWRSYYLNRMAVRRHGLPQNATAWHQPTAAHTN